MATPLCPRDATPLALKADVLGPTTQAHVCPACAGVLVDWKHGQPFYQSLGLSLADLQTLVKEAQARPEDAPAPAACTSCGQGPMRPFVWKGVELDLCESCGASWLDRGELQRISGGKLGQGVGASSKKVAGIYEMLWDCRYCDAKELLGKTHRYCPGCGAPQDASARYFPPPGKETAASAQYDGVDRSCPACQTPNGAKSNNCRHCGSPLDGAQAVKRVAEPGSAAPAAAPPKAEASPKKRRWWLWALIGAVLSCCLCTGVSALWTEDATITVQGHEWSREIDVERLQPVKEEAWCDSTPSGAYDVTKRREERSTRQVRDGETCTTRDVDRGDGTFERRRECEPRYREESIYDDRCSFTIDRWKKTRTEVARGESLSPAPAWPTVRPGGNEREGPRRETYVLHLQGKDSKRHSCNVDLSKWQAIADGARKSIKMRVVTGSPDCDSL